VTYGDRLRELRAERRLSLREVEERGGPNKDTMSLIERGIHKPRPQTLGRIAEALDMSVPELRAELEAAESPLARAPHDTQEYGALLEELGFPPEQIESWRKQEEHNKGFMAREFEKMTVKDYLEQLIASPGAQLMRSYYRNNPPQKGAPPRRESA
jgi:transcriptional regulator with XRE-family HTH domain